MGDIVAELRKWADAPIKSPPISKALREAVDEIERLRAELHHWKTCAKAHERGDYRR